MAGASRADADDARCLLCRYAVTEARRADADDARDLRASCQRQAELMLMMLVVFVCHGQLVLMMLAI